MPQISTNRLGSTTSFGDSLTAAEAAFLLVQLASDLEEEICRALLDDNAALAERLAALQARIKKMSLIFGSPKLTVSGN